MSIRDRLLAMIAVGLMTTAVSPAMGQVLYSQDFDVDDTANWTVNNGPSDEAHNFFYDYSTVGIPSAPNSTGGSTRGMQLQANLVNAVFSGMSVSPNGQSFTGDYSVTFDWWQNYLGPLGPGAAGSTMLTTVGAETTGTFDNWPGRADGTYFAVTGDGNSSVDLRVYTPERPVSHQLPANTDLDMNPATIEIDSLGNPIDSHANYLGNTRNSNVAPYTTAFPGGASAPAIQQTTYPTTQTGTTNPGAAGFVWNEMELRKEGNIFRLLANGVEIMNYDKTLALTPNAGTNIMFGHADINAGTNLLDPNYPILQFTLIDNVQVVAAAAPADADFDNDGDEDGEDFLIWQRGLGGAGGTANANGNADGDSDVDGDDLAIWQTQFTAAVPAVASIPEPSTWALAALACAACLAIAAPRRRAELARVNVGR